jgi:hypothetical protein
LGYRGPKFTWSNCREGSAFIKEWLDRIVVNLGWCELFPDVEVIVEASTTSDHAVVEVYLNGKQAGNSTTRLFKYEACWTLDQGYNDAFLCAWQQPAAIGDYWIKLDKKLTICKNGIAEWKKSIVRIPQQSTYRLKQKLNKVQGRSGEQTRNEALILQQEINILTDQEDLKWRQRAKADWLRMGDQNTK